MWRSWHRTSVQTKIVQDLFKNNLLFLNNTVKRHPEARLWLRAFHSETHRRVRWKLTLVCDSWFLGCNRGVCLNCTPVAFQHPLMRLRFLWFLVKYLLWVGAFLLGWNEGQVLPRYGIFQTSWVKPTPYACQPKNKAAKTLQLQIEAERWHVLEAWGPNRCNIFVHPHLENLDKGSFSSVR